MIVFHKSWISILKLLWLAFTKRPSCKYVLVKSSILNPFPGLEFTTVPSNQTVQEQKEALFFCAVDVADATITWYVNDQKVTMKRHNFVVTSGSGRSTLEVLQAKRKDQGSVVCRISTSQSDEYALSSPQAYLNVVKGRGNFINCAPLFWDGYPCMWHDSLFDNLFSALLLISTAFIVE